MTNLFNKMFNKEKNNETKQKQAQPAPIPQPGYDFVEQYTLVNPKNLFMDYNLWSMCETLPVAVEGKESGTGFAQCVRLKTNVLLPFIQKLENAPTEVSKKQEMRTISIINMKHGAKAYVFPDLEKDQVYLLTVLEKKQKNLPISCFVTPEINRAIVAQSKIYGNR